MSKESSGLRKLAYEYFTTHPWYSLNLQPQLIDQVFYHWFSGKSLRETSSIILKSQLGIKSVVGYKSHISNFAEIDVDADAVTRDILAGFIDTVKKAYDLLNDNDEVCTAKALYDAYQDISRREAV